ncbi:MAG: hypothetical protein JKY59_05035 [Emcibacter sp.]|nr:hypothetical protein [Emcibacter sp.]
MSLIRAIVTSVLVIFAFNVTANATTSCRPPLAPTIPNGKTAPKADILAALMAIKQDFQPAIKNFQNCIATEKEAVGDVATERQIAEWDQLYDAAYALETQVAENMNVAIRAFKARIAKKAE